MEMPKFNNVRVRIAPSPTGFVHIGNLRTILYNYLFAKHYGGKFIVRVEDTDQTRLVQGALENLLQVLDWAGIKCDEGPYLTKTGKVREKGEFGPYVQSQRLDIYKQQIKDLLDKNKAYPCFCSKERLNDLRAGQMKNKQAPKYDNFCRDLSKSEAAAMMSKGAPYVIRFKMPENKDIVVNDLIHGVITVNTKNLDDYVLIKADGFPTYHFANVVDDHQMKITQVLRGEEWIASTPKHILLYDAFGWQSPQFAHLPQLLNKQKKKLSKRDGDTSVKDFIASGYLKEALINFIALLGWNSGTEQEIYTLDELVKQFTLDNVHKAGAVFDLDKFDWINGIYLRNQSLDIFYDLCLPFLEKANLITPEKNQLLVNETGERLKPKQFKEILALEQSRAKKISEIPAALDYFFKNELTYAPKSLIWKKSNQKETAERLTRLAELLKSVKEESFNTKTLEKIIREFIDKNSFDTGSILWPMRFCLSGKEKSPGPFELAAALGKEKTLARINSAISKLA